MSSRPSARQRTEEVARRGRVRTEPYEEREPPKYTRLSVNVSNSTADALREIARDKGLTMTEALRRLVGYGIVVYRAVRDGSDVLIRRGDKIEKIVPLD